MAQLRAALILDSNVHVCMVWLHVHLERAYTALYTIETWRDSETKEARGLSEMVRYNFSACGLLVLSAIMSATGQCPPSNREFMEPTLTTIASSLMWLPVHSNS